MKLPSSLVQAVMLLTCIWKVLNSNLRQNNDYPQVSCGFPQSLLENAKTVPHIMPQLLPSISFPNDWTTINYITWVPESIVK
jgi:hypothetical protein